MTCPQCNAPVFPPLQDETPVCINGHSIYTREHLEFLENAPPSFFKNLLSAAKGK